MDRRPPGILLAAALLLLCAGARPVAAQVHRLEKDRTDYAFWPIAAGRIPEGARYLSLELSVPEGTVLDVSVREEGGEAWLVGLGYTILDQGAHRAVFGLGPFPGPRFQVPKRNDETLIFPASGCRDRGLPPGEARPAPRGDGVLEPRAIVAVEIEFPATRGWTGPARPSVYEVRDVRFEKISPRERLLEEGGQAAVSVRFDEDLGPLNPLWKDACLTGEGFAELGQRLYKVFGAAAFGPFYAPAGGSEGAYDWSRVDRELELAGRSGEEIQVVIGRDVPPWLWAEGKGMGEPGSRLGPWKRGHLSPPADLEAYGEVVSRLAKHIQEDGPRKTDSFLVWGGPDGSEYFLGTIDDYLDVYQACALAIERADPEVLVGGPSPDPFFSADWVGRFIDGVAARKAPVDFVSLHNYNLYPDQTLRMARWVAERLRRHEALAGTEIHFDEYNSGAAVTPGQQAFKRSVANAAYAAATIGALTDAAVSRACYSSPHRMFAAFGTTLVERDGAPRPILRTFQLLNRLAGRRVAVVVDRTETGLGGLAALEGETARCVLWAYAPERPHDAGPLGVAASVVLEGLPGPSGEREVRLRRVDREHAIEPEAGVRRVRVEGGRAELELEIELPSVLLVEIAPAERGTDR